MRHLGLCAQGSSLAWLLQRISLGLTLSLWRVYLVLMPMARTAFKVRRSKSTCEAWGPATPRKGIGRARPIWGSPRPSLQALTDSESGRGPSLRHTLPRVPGKQVSSQGDKGIGV
uniref:Uncharacterized protein n=1 Tax=Pan paniscus TaxID=9597 RepID=A0A2R9C414_PANPA